MTADPRIGRSVADDRQGPFCRLSEILQGRRPYLHLLAFRWGDDIVSRGDASTNVQENAGKGLRVISNMTPEQVRQAVFAFAKRYVTDWEEWSGASAQDRASRFGAILRRWRATRPYPMRRTRDEAEHSPPFLEDLLAQARPHLDQLQDVTVLSMGTITPSQRKALHGLWYVFRRLPSRGSASCVGITKAVLLLTGGRIGPALDSTVRHQLGIGHVVDPDEWIRTLVETSLDIRTFELKYDVSFIEAMPPEFKHLQVGRLCDMVLGPRE